MKKSPPTCAAALKWLRERYGRDALAPITGQDARALAAWFHLVELWGCGDLQGQAAAEIALAAVLDGMQRSVWKLAKAGIPAVLDWSHEPQLWAAVERRRAELFPTGRVSLAGVTFYNREATP